MAAAWGGYVFVANLVSVYAMVLVACGRYSVRLYVAYSTFYVLGLLLAMQVQFVGINHVKSWEHIAGMAMFAFLQVCFNS